MHIESFAANSLRTEAMRSMAMMEFCPLMRSRVIQFLIQSARVLEVSPMAKYSALALFSDRFYPALSSLKDDKGSEHWLLYSIGDGNLQLFALVSLWVTSKIHDTPPLSLKSLKLLSDKFIKEQHYTNGDLMEAEIVFMQVLKFGIGTSNIAFSLVEELVVHLAVIARVGEHVKFEACMDVMDLLYEREEIALLHSSPQALAASIVAVAYIIAVPLQAWEFPVIPWAMFVSLCKEEELLDHITIILKHIFEEQNTN